jgi:hypothetical protein
MFELYHNRSFLLTLILNKNHDMCHDTIDFGLIEIESHHD